MFYKTKKFMLIILLSIIIPHNFVYAGKIRFNMCGNIYTLDDSQITFSISNRIVPVQDKCTFAFTLCEYFDMRIQNEMKSNHVRDLLHTKEMLEILILYRQSKDILLLSARIDTNIITQMQNNIEYYNRAIHKYSQVSLKCDELMHTAINKKSSNLIDLFKNYFMAKIKYYRLCIERCEILFEAHTRRR